MTTIKTIVIIGIVLSLISCGTSAVENVDQKEQSIAAESYKLDIELNKGEKWKVNDQMMPFMKSSEQLLVEFQKKGNGDYKMLAADLKETNSKLISSCTMKGKSHDALHVWLHPHLDLVNELQNSETEEEATLVMEKLNRSFLAFSNYFQ
ncbi:MAG: hypothetical protein ACI91R_001332 [Vicingaceae bacterium]|jgi:hypothetical protein